MSLKHILEQFAQHVEDVDRLVDFDKEVLHIAISTVEDLHERLVRKQGITNEHLNGGRVLVILRGVRDHESLKPRYSLILNQAVVLLVSYFASAVEGTFAAAVKAILQTGPTETLLREELRVSVADIREANMNPDDGIASLLIEKKDLSFQDMQAIHRAFRDYLSVDIQRDSRVNDIVLAQACRHVIVHAGGEATPRLVRQIRGALPRNVKLEIADGARIQFSHVEVKRVAKSMTEYLKTLVEKTEAAISRPS